MAGITVSNLGMCECIFGVAPTPLIVPPLTLTLTDGMPAASILDMIPFMNIEPFGICNSPANPMVIAAKLVGAPAPCIPIIVSPWIPTAPNVLVGGQPVLTLDSVTFCAWAGVIKVIFPGEINVISI